jgi:hypothetical protein
MTQDLLCLMHLYTCLPPTHSPVTSSTLGIPGRCTAGRCASIQLLSSATFFLWTTRSSERGGRCFSHHRGSLRPGPPPPPWLLPCAPGRVATRLPSLGPAWLAGGGTPPSSAAAPVNSTTCWVLAGSQLALLCAGATDRCCLPRECSQLWRWFTGACRPAPSWLPPPPDPADS